MTNRIAIGTCQFGLPYGIANQVGQVSRNEAAEIINCAFTIGMDTLDTAISYGESEQVLGEIGVGRWRIISKLPVFSKSFTGIDTWVREQVNASLKRLRVSSLHALLLHNSQLLYGSHGKELYQALLALKEQGQVGKIGLSIYGPDELDTIWRHYRFDLIQAPFNVIDRRIITSGWLNRLHNSGIEVHIRSIFLQGLLLMDETQRPAPFRRWQPLWQQWRWLLDKHALTPLQACVGFAVSQSEVDRVIVGVDSLKQLQEIMACVKGFNVISLEALVSEDPELINPSRWSLH